MCSQFDQRGRLSDRGINAFSASWRAIRKDFEYHSLTFVPSEAYLHDRMVKFVDRCQKIELMRPGVSS